ncbi:hypothetical protein [Rosistilla ulvae]|uniref:hypothetical protein n=1 Tax=Rosistilla ulvae TaxID=1930277 RepID=UPI001C54DE29|nr:hypothetical protein [Rosistilla ulvae]
MRTDLASCKDRSKELVRSIRVLVRSKLELELGSKRVLVRSKQELELGSKQELLRSKLVLVGSTS